MRILQTISGLNTKSGGPSRSTYLLALGLNNVGANVDLMTIAPANPDERNIGNGEPWLHQLPNDYTLSSFGYSKNMRTFLLSSDYDLYHTNGLWMYCNHITAKAARKRDKPFVLTPRGMLYPDALNRSKYVKYIVRKMWFDNDILNADCIHATCDEEAKCVRQFGYKGPVAVVGNVVDIPSYATLATSKPQGKKLIGYLGRLHPRKGVERILQAIAQSTKEVRDSLEFHIMGKGLADYEDYLHKEVARLGLQDIVMFDGFVQGEEKYRRLRDLSALFVPSDFENFGMIIPEALISGTPVCASLGTPWQNLNTYSCGWWMDRTVDNLMEVLRQVATMPVSDILAMGARGRRLVEDSFTSPIISAKMLTLYRWIVEGGEKPDFVV